MAFTVDQVLRIWDLVICNANFISVFAAVMMCDLKQKLVLMTLSECLNNMKNLEGIIDFDQCLSQAGKLCDMMPGSFFIVNTAKSNSGLYDNEFYQSHPWEIPPTVSELQARPCFIISLHDLSMPHLLVDVRSKREYET